jgi:hypothetical protein
MSDSSTRRSDVKTRTIKVLVGIAVVVLLGLAGAAIAGASGAFGGDSALSGDEAERAKTAALAVTGGGTVNETERDSEDGATYEVEVTRPDGKTVDVRLDSHFELVVVDGDSEEQVDEDQDGSDEEGPDEDGS